MERTDDGAMSPQSTAPSRVLYIVARDRPDLYAALRNAFVESSRLGIVLDRRDNPPAARAQTDRRQVPIGDALRAQGWACVRIEADGRVSLIDDSSVTGKESDGPRPDR